MTARGGAPVRLAAAELPACLGDLSHPPAALWYLGEPGVLAMAPERTVAIVGTRECSEYGERTASRLAAACARAGLLVVSGLARGVDAAAHRAALASMGPTVAVQGTGVDIPYPARHRALHAEVVRSGLVVSEMEPGTLARPGCFPRRNRLIAALAKVTVVVEAGFKSGAINTATQALELGRMVAAVPGRIDDPRAAGTNALIRDGAHVITDVDDLLTLLGLSTLCRDLDAPATAGAISIDDHGAAVLAALAGGASRLEQIAAVVEMPYRQVERIVLDLELRSLVDRSEVGYRLAVAPAARPLGVAADGVQ